MLQVQTFAWPRSPASGDLEPTRELIAVPPVFELAGNGKQIIRVALRGPAAGRPRAGLPAAGHRGAARRRLGDRRAVRAAAQPAGVRRPRPSAAALPAWSLRPTAGKPVLALDNRGSAHLQVRRIVAARPGQAARRSQTIEAATYVLAGQSQAWPLADAVAGQHSLQLEAETNLGPIQAAVALPQRLACWPPWRWPSPGRAITSRAVSRSRSPIRSRMAITRGRRHWPWHAAVAARRRPAARPGPALPIAAPRRCAEPAPAAGPSLEAVVPPAAAARNRCRQPSRRRPFPAAAAALPDPPLPSVSSAPAKSVLPACRRHAAIRSCRR